MKNRLRDEAEAQRRPGQAREAVDPAQLRPAVIAPLRAGMRFAWLRAMGLAFHAVPQGTGALADGPVPLPAIAASGRFQRVPGSTARADVPVRRGGRRRPAKRSLRAPLWVGALAAVGLWFAVGVSAAQAGVRIVAPADEAIKPKANVRVALAVRDVGSLRVSLDNNDITRRLARHGRLREAVLRGRLVEPGAHWLNVRWRPAGGGVERAIERRVLVARRFRSLAGKLSPRRSVDSTSGVLRLRLSVRRGVGLMRVRVNGRRVRVPHIGRLWPTTTLTLGARHGLRFGRNRVSVLAHHFRKAGYDRESWTVVMRRSRPLAAGIAKHRADAGGRAVRLDGRGARATRAGRRLRWSWRIVRKPRGSRARLVGRQRPRPRLRPDVPGRYRLTLTISEHTRRRGARAAQTGPETVHPVTVVADAKTPPLGASLKIDLGGQNRDGSIVLDDAPAAGLPDSDCWNGSPPAAGARRCVYPLRAPSVYPYLLVLDAQTLAPKVPIKQLPSRTSFDDLWNAIRSWADPHKNVIAILVNGGTRKYSGDPAPPQIAELEKPSAYIFTPIASLDLGIRSGWYSEASTSDNVAEAEISGFFQKSWPVGSAKASDQYQFVPGNYVEFDTSRGGDPAGQNTMVVGGKQYTSQLTGGAADGFQVLVLDKTLTPMLDTPTTFANGAPIGNMAALLQRARTTPGASTVFVQSIGRPNPYTASANDAWNSAAQQLEAFGANTDVFLNLSGPDWPRPQGTTGWYSFVAGLDPGCASSNDRCQAATEASTPLTEASGDVSGVLGRNQTWQYAPLIDEVGGDEHTGELLTLAYRPPSKWPFSDDPDARRILHWLSQYDRGATDLTALGNGDCYDPGNLRDVRSSYCSIRINWASLKAGLGDSQTRTGVCGNPKKEPGDPAFDPAKYAQVCDQISREIAQLSDVKDDMMQVKNQMGTDHALIAYFTVQKMADQVKSAVESGPAKANRRTTADALELAAQLVEWYSLFWPEGGPPIGEFMGAALTLAGEITSLAEGDEQGESALAKPVTLDPARLGLEIEQRLSAAGSAFDHAWDMLVSDPAKLNAAHQNFVVDPNNRKEECAQPGVTCGIWKGVPDDLDSRRPMMQNGVRHWAAGKFMAATFDVWLVDTLQGKGPLARDVTPADVHTIGCDVVSSSGASWPPFYQADDPNRGGEAKPTNIMPEDAAYYLRDRLGLTQPKTDRNFSPNPVPRHGSNMWVLAQGDLSDKGNWPYKLPTGARYWPPKPLLDDLYAPPNDRAVGGGYGWERPWLYSRGQHFNIHGSDWTTKRCGWFAPDRVPWLP